jgi:hypothetical protein
MTLPRSTTDRQNKFLGFLALGPDEDLLAFEFSATVQVLGLEHYIALGRYDVREDSKRVIDSIGASRNFLRCV